MRRDVKIGVETKDLLLARLHLYTHKFAWVTNEVGLNQRVYGEVTLNEGAASQQALKEGVVTHIPYTPLYKDVSVRIKRFVGGREEFVLNPTDGSVWFDSTIKASELVSISRDLFHIVFVDGEARFYSGYVSDFIVELANNQNSRMLLECVAGNNYRHPLSGVGLIHFTNSNMNQEELSRVLQNEFENDGVKVKSASYDFDKKDLLLDLDTENVDRE